MKTGQKAAIAFAFLLGMGSLATPARAGHCSVAKAAGNYGFTLNGVLLLPTGPVPVAAVGQAKLDANGNVSGTEARNIGGDFADETSTGTFTINADCTGTATVSFFESGQLVRTSILSIVVDDDNREIRMVQQSLTLPNGATVPVVLTVEARRIQRDGDN